MYSKIIPLIFFAGVLCGLTANAQILLYANAQMGGADSVGAIISFNPANNHESVVYSFKSDTDAQFPVSNLVVCPLNGLLYGVSPSGGSQGYGTIYSFNPATGTEQVLWSFGVGSDASQPDGSLVWDSTRSVFYGVSPLGGTNNTGGVYRFNPVTNQERLIWHFNNTTGPALSGSTLVYDPVNDLYYGMGSEGGNTDAGAIFSFNPAVDSAKKVFSFHDGADGMDPEGSLTFYNGVLYGTTSEGGTDSVGVLFSYIPGDTVVSVLHVFGSTTNDGSEPDADLVADNQRGVLYGMTPSNGDYGGGTIYSYNPSTQTYTQLYSFGVNVTDGIYPTGDLVLDPSNDLYYGLTDNGGTYNFGTVFSFDPSNNTVNFLYSFGNGADGTALLNSFLVTGTSTASGVSNISAAKPVLYPNPGRGLYTLSGLSAGADIEVFDELGQRVLNLETSASIQTLDMQALADGVYVLQIKTSDQLSQVIRVVKTR
jgi:uncharacterized repeat protein (TIGR03803 family)